MASVSGLSSSGLNFTGLATGIDTAKMVEGLTALSARRIDTLKARQSDIVTKQTTFAVLQGKLFDLQSKAARLARSAGGAFDGRTAESSDKTVVTAAAGTAAVAGTYTLTVNALAQAHQVTSGGFSDPNAAIKQGTLTLQVGSGTATTITVGANNATLQGLANSINTAGGDVRASVINDGSATPYRLLLTATRTGAANAITVTNNLTTGTGATIDPAATTIQAAADAQVKLGSGSGALTVNSGTNVLTNLIAGVSLTLQRADAAKPLTVTVASDTAGASEAIKDFVESYNGVLDFIGERSKFDAATNQAGLLLGNRDVTQLVGELAAALNTSVPGLSTGANRLSSAGLSFDEKGKLKLDDGKLAQTLANPNGTALTDLKKLFAWSGGSDNPGVEFVVASDKTKPTGGTPYTVNVTAPATRASVTATSSTGPLVTLSPPNNLLQVKINGLLSGDITLDAGSYSAEALASLLQQKINSSTALNGNLVSVDVTDSKLRITSQTYGSASTVEVVGGTALAALGFSANQAASGTNVAGEFLVNGQTQTATGAGQMLSGSAGNTQTDGLQVRSTLGAPGNANLTLSQGLAGRLNGVLAKYLDSANGRFKTIDDTFRQQTEDIDKTITRQNDVLEQKTADLQRQFAAMESAVSKLKGLQGQLASLVPASLSR